MIHFAVLSDHFEEYWAYGVFFAVVAWLQVLWPILLLLRPSPALLISGATGNAAVIAVWVISRTAGVPLGPGSGVAEPAQFIDILATVYEGLIVAVCLMLMRRFEPRVVLPRTARSVALLALPLAVASLTIAALVSGTGTGGHAESGHGHGLAGERAPADGGAPSEGSESQSGVAFRYQTDQGRFVLLQIAPFRVGNNRIKITIFDSNEEPSAIDEATILLSRLESEDPDTEVRATRSGSPPYVEAELELNNNGWWRFKAVLPAGDIADFYARLDDPSGAPLDVARSDYASESKAERLYEQALANYEGLTSVRWREELTSGLLAPAGTGAWVVTSAEIEAPDRLHYEVLSPGSSHYQAYRVGNSSCTQDLGKAWQCNTTSESSNALELDYLKPTAFRLGRSELVDGEMTRVLLFYNPSQPAWYAWWVGQETGFLRRQVMVAPGHFMLTHFFDHNAPLTIQIPQEALTSGG